MAGDRVPLRVDVHRDAGSTIVRIAGELDAASAPRLRFALEELADGPERRLVVDLGALDFIDCSGLAVLEDLGCRLRLRQAALVLRRPSRSAARLLDLRQRICGAGPWEIERSGPAASLSQ